MFQWILSLFGEERRDNHENFDYDEMLENLKKAKIIPVSAIVDPRNLRLVVVQPVQWYKTKTSEQLNSASQISGQIGTKVKLKYGIFGGLPCKLSLPLKGLPWVKKNQECKQIEIFIDEKEHHATDVLSRNPRYRGQKCEAKFKCRVRMKGTVKFTSYDKGRPSVDEVDASELFRGKRCEEWDVKGTCTFHL